MGVSTTGELHEPVGGNTAPVVVPKAALELMPKR